MRTVIEKYRGFEITFDSDNEAFSSEIADGPKLSAIKKSIDEHMKSAAGFEPFFIRHIQTGEKKKIVSIRKDGEFMYMDEHGKSRQFPKYGQGEWILCVDSDDIIFAGANEKDESANILRDEAYKLRRSATGTPLREYRERFKGE